MRPRVLARMLRESNYDKAETDYLVQGFTQGFDLRYGGPKVRKSTSKNLPFSVGNRVILWNKLMAEVKLK